MFALFVCFLMFTIIADAPRQTSVAPAKPAPRPQRTEAFSKRGMWACIGATAFLWWLAGQRFGLFALGWVALLPLLWALSPLPAKSRFRWGYVAGFVAFWLHNYWLVPTITNGAPAIGASPLVGFPLSLLAVSLIALIHGGEMALTCVVWSPQSKWARRAPWLAPLLFAASWWTFDYLRCIGPLAHAWGALAYTQTRDLPLLQVAAFIGQHGLSALCAWVAASLALWLRRGEPSCLWPPLLVLALLHLGGAWRLHSAPAPSSTFRALLVQTDVPSLRKSAQAGGETPFSQAYGLTRDALDEAQARGETLDLVMWPETTIAVGKSSEEATASTRPPEGVETRLILDLARLYNVPLLVGASVRLPDGKQFNQGIRFSLDGAQASSSKHRLVPYGERAVGGGYLPFLNQLAPQPPLEHGRKGSQVPVLICFESCFPEPARELVQGGAKQLFVITNDEWFRGTTAPWEHASMAYLRAVENGVPVVQVANGGHSLVVDRFGRGAVNSANFPMSRFGEARAFVISVPE